MQMMHFANTERSIRERKIQVLSEDQGQRIMQQPSTWAADLANDNYRRKIEAIEQQRADGLRQFRRQGMPDWALAILTEVADRRAICPSDIVSRKRHRPIIEARRDAAYLIKARKPALSCPLLGKWFNMDHTSIMHLIACYQAEHNAPKLVGYDLARVRMRNAETSAKAREYAREKQLTA